MIKESIEMKKNIDLRFDEAISVSDLFYAVEGTNIECLNCHTKTYNYQVYFFIY